MHDHQEDWCAHGDTILQDEVTTTSATQCGTDPARRNTLKALVANMKTNTVPLAPSSVRCARYLGCLRCFPASYYSPAVLTKRGWHECASVLRHHPIFAETVGTQHSRGLWVTPRMGEWNQGLPRGRAATAPLEEPVEPMVRTGGWQQAISNRMSCVDLFTGCGGWHSRCGQQWKPFSTRSATWLAKPSWSRA